MTAIMPLYALANNYEALGQRLLEAEGELTPELAMLWDTLDSEILQKVENTALYIRNLEATAKAEEEESLRFKARYKTKRAAAESLKAYLKLNLERVGKDRVETLRVKARIQNNPRPSIRWTGDIHKCPVEFIRVTVDLDGTKSYDHWKQSGTDDASRSLPEGFRVDRGTHLRLS